MSNHNNCPLCGSKVVYVGLSSIECAGLDCIHGSKIQDDVGMILESWSTAKTQFCNAEGLISHKVWDDLAHKLGGWLYKPNQITDTQAQNVGRFMNDCTVEAALVVWGFLAGNADNLWIVAPYIRQRMLDIASGAGC